MIYGLRQGTRKQKLYSMKSMNQVIIILASNGNFELGFFHKITRDIVEVRDDLTNHPNVYSMHSMRFLMKLNMFSYDIKNF